MAFIYQEWRTVAAGVFAAFAIGGAYLLATGSGAPRVAEASTETALLNQIATKDSTGDGLPDWQKALYGIPTDATTTDYFHLGMTDGEAVAKGLIVPVAATPAAPAATGGQAPAASFGLSSPAAGSLTDTFAKSFFSLYVSASQQNNGTLSSDQINTLADQALAELSASVVPAPDFKAKADIKVAGSGADAMRAYAASAEAVLSEYAKTPAGNELADLQDFLNTSNPSDITDLQASATFYQQSATGLAALQVPQEVSAAQLALVNALWRMGAAITDFSNVGTDPLTAMLALNQYPQDELALAAAFQGIAEAYAVDGITLTPGTPGGFFVNASAIIQARAAAEQQP